MKVRKVFLFFLVVFFIFSSLYSFADEKDNLYRYQAARYDGGSEISIDGKLDEAVWIKSAPITNFIQTDPDEGTPATERTEVYIFYDDENIYFGFICYDSEPDKIVTYVRRRDRFEGSDFVTVLLDTFCNLRNGYSFSLNAEGVQQDAFLSEVAGGRRRGYGPSGITRDENWDGIWMGAARVTDFGWTAEIAIPFKTIRFNPAKDQTWGLNISRYIARKNEDASWVPVKRYDRVMRPSKAGKLEGIREVTPGRNIELVPFFVYRNESHLELEENIDTKFQRVKPGLNFRYGITANLTADFALNPDFAQAEIDVQNINLSKYELFYPEKRAFFMEGADIFKTPIQLFFSRRIGSILPDYSEQQLVLGGKVIGSVGKNRIGIVESAMSSTPYYDPEDDEHRDAASANFFVFRWQRDILSKSSIGFITVNRDQKYDGEFDTQRAHGIDLTLNLGDHTQVYSQFVASYLPGNNPDYDTDNDADFTNRSAFVAGTSYRSNQFEANIGFQNIGEDFDVSWIGYHPRVDRLGGDGAMVIRPYIFRYGIRNLNFEARYTRLFNHSDELEDYSAYFEFGVDFTNFWHIEAGYDVTDERYYLFEDGVENEDITILYRTKRTSFRLFTARNKPVVVRLMMSKGDYLDYDDCFLGKNYNLDLGLESKIGTRLTLDFDVRYIREFYRDGSFQENRGLYVTRVYYSFSPKTRIRFLGQYNVKTAQLTTDSLFSYDFTARSGFFIGFRDRRNLDPVSFEPEERRFFFKISYLLSL
jgi:hypothetical protein